MIALIIGLLQILAIIILIEMVVIAVALALVIIITVLSGLIDYIKSFIVNKEENKA